MPRGMLFSQRERITEHDFRRKIKTGQTFEKAGLAVMD